MNEWRLKGSPQPYIVWMSKVGSVPTSSILTAHFDQETLCSSGTVYQPIREDLSSRVWSCAVGPLSPKTRVEIQTARPRRALGKRMLKKICCLCVTPTTIIIRLSRFNWSTGSSNFADWSHVSYLSFLSLSSLLPAKTAQTENNWGNSCDCCLLISTTSYKGFLWLYLIVFCFYTYTVLKCENKYSKSNKLT